jgi:hypothetical protein
VTDPVALLLGGAALGSALYRWRGHGKVSGPRWLKLSLCAGFLCLPLAVAGAWPLLAGALPLAWWGLSRAHGSYYDLGHNGAGSEADWRWAELQLAALRWLPLREGLLLAITGLAATLGPGWRWCWPATGTAGRWRWPAR